MAVHPVEMFVVRPLGMVNIVDGDTDLSSRRSKFRFQSLQLFSEESLLEAHQFPAEAG